MVVLQFSLRREFAVGDDLASFELVCPRSGNHRSSVPAAIVVIIGRPGSSAVWSAYFDELITISKLSTILHRNAEIH
jgi:hypothetical protein